MTMMSGKPWAPYTRRNRPGVCDYLLKPLPAIAAGLPGIHGECTMKEVMEHREKAGSPPAVQRFRDWTRSEPGKTRVLYSKADDPETELSKRMTHGVLADRRDEKIVEMLNPPSKTVFQDAVLEAKESKYKRPPLGKIRDQTAGLPRGLDPESFTFGDTTYKDPTTAGELINPPLSRQQVNEMSCEGHDLYVRSHKDYCPGEHTNRNYAPPFDPFAINGDVESFRTDGYFTKEAMHWKLNKEIEKRTPLVEKQHDKFSEKFSNQLGQTRDSNKETRSHLAPDHTFGWVRRVKECTVADLVHYKLPDSYLKGQDRIAGIVAFVRNKLRLEYYSKLPELLAAMEYHDENKTNELDAELMFDLCNKYQLPVDHECLQELFRFCDPGYTGCVFYRLFGQLIDWKWPLQDLEFPESQDSFDQMTSSGTKRSFERDCVEPKRAAPGRIGRSQRVGVHGTTSSVINEPIGNFSKFPKAGLPSVRNDIAAPFSKPFGKDMDYGDSPSVYSVMYPSIYGNKGIHEHDFFKPRSKQEMRSIFRNIGVEIGDQSFEAIYRVAEQESPTGHACLETFRNVLDRIYTDECKRREIVPPDA